MIENVRLARETVRPICQDTGVPVFFVKVPMGLSHVELRETIRDATRIATAKVPLRPNAVDVITEKNSGDNTGAGFPLVYLEETGGATLTIDLLMKGGGSENVGQLYKLPIGELEAQRDLDGVRKCVLDAIQKAPAFVGLDIAHERLVDLELVHRQLLQIAQAGEAGAKVVDGELHAQPVHLIQET